MHVRHEEAAAFAASAEAALTGELAVCAASCGPGNLHLINGLYDANRSRVPVLALAAHIPSEEIGGRYFQETHPQDLFRECSVYCELVSLGRADAARGRDGDAGGDRAARRRRARRARATCSRRRRSSTEDRPAIRRARPSPAPPTPRSTRPPPRSTRRKRPAILAGAGCEGAHAELIALASALKAPIVHSAARQGARRVRQPVRRRHDRPARLQLRLPRASSTATCC